MRREVVRAMGLFSFRDLSALPSVGRLGQDLGKEEAVECPKRHVNAQTFRAFRVFCWRHFTLLMHPGLVV